MNAVVLQIVILSRSGLAYARNTTFGWESHYNSFCHIQRMSLNPIFFSSHLISSHYIPLFPSLPLPFPSLPFSSILFRHFITLTFTSILYIFKHFLTHCVLGFHLWGRLRDVLVLPVWPVSDCEGDWRSCGNDLGTVTWTKFLEYPGSKTNIYHAKHSHLKKNILKEKQTLI